MEAKLNKGKDPTMRDLFIHLHCRRDSKGKSPIVAKLEAAAEAEKLRAEQMELRAEQMENADAIGHMDPSTEEIPTGIEELDVNSLQFTNTRTKSIYVSRTSHYFAEFAYLSTKQGQNICFSNFSLYYLNFTLFQQQALLSYSNKSTFYILIQYIKM